MGAVEEQALGRNACPLPNETTDLSDLFVGEGDEVNADDSGSFALGVFQDKGLSEQGVVDVGAGVGSCGVARQPNANGWGDVHLGNSHFPSHRPFTSLSEGRC